MRYLIKREIVDKEAWASQRSPEDRIASSPLSTYGRPLVWSEKKVKLEDPGLSPVIQQEVWSDLDEDDITAVSKIFFLK